VECDDSVSLLGRQLVETALWPIKQSSRGRRRGRRRRKCRSGGRMTTFIIARWAQLVLFSFLFNIQLATLLT